MSHSSWKPLYNTNSFCISKKNQEYKNHFRNSIITAEFINSTVKIYNGIRFFEIFITAKMLGHKFGEFAPSRKFPLHKKKKIKKKK